MLQQAHTLSNELFDVPQIIKTLELFHPNGQGFEIRALRAKWGGAYSRPGILRGYFTDPKLAASAITKLQSFEAIYHTCQRINEDICARCYGRLDICGRDDSTKKADVVEYQRLAVDADPVRPAGISSTDDEHQAAEKRIKEVGHFLRDQGLSLECWADSGNGYHATYRLCLPADDESESLLKRVLSALSARFSDNMVKIDTQVFDRARILKLYGTLARKGDPTPHRHHRMSRLLEVGPQTINPRELLESVAAMAPPEQTSTKPKTRAAKSDTQVSQRPQVEEPLATPPDNPAWPPLEKRIDRCRKYLEQLPEAEEGDNGSGRTFHAAAVIAKFGVEGDAAMSLLRGYNVDKCIPEWSEAELLHKWEDARRAVIAAGEWGLMLAPKDDALPGIQLSGQAATSRKSIATQLVELLDDRCEIWKDGDNFFATFREGGRRITMRVGSKEFRPWLAHAFYEEHDKAPSRTAIDEAVATVTGRELFRSHGRQASLRVAGDEHRVHVDLCDDTWRAVEIDADGFRIVDEPPVYFHRTRAMLPLPEPVGRDDDLCDLLASVINVPAEQCTVLVAWLLSCLHPRGPYWVLGLQGEQGSRKTTAATLLRGLVDPHSVPLRSHPPKTPQDHVIAAQSQHVCAIDNLSGIPAWFSDVLCCVATGAGFGARTLYTDDSETILSAKKPQLLTGISFIGSRPDLLERTLLVRLPVVEHRRLEGELLAKYEAIRPRMLGALYAMVSRAIADSGEVAADLARRGLDFRMADVATWALAGVGERREELLEQLLAIRDDARDVMLDGWAVWGPLQRLLTTCGPGFTEAMSSELLGLLNGFATLDERRSPGWPGSAESLAGQLRRFAPDVRRAGWTIEFTCRGKGRESRKIIAIALPGWEFML